jgi:hypothetical protein
MKTFEFPAQLSSAPNPSSAFGARGNKEPKPLEARAPGGGFFGGFNGASKNKKATLSKQQREEKDQKLKQYRDIIGVSDDR